MESGRLTTGVQVRVPATSANLGPGLDTLGLALGLHNDIMMCTAESGATVSIEGEGEGRFATGEGNLVIRSARAVLEELGAPGHGLVLHCVNRIPSARGLGSSAASIVAGVVAGFVLARDASTESVDDGALTAADLEWVLDFSAKLEGHPDNVAGCLLGGMTIAWYDPTGQARAVRADPSPGLGTVALVPAGRVSTADARKLLPDAVPLTDAAHSAGRAALLALALTTRPELLLPATEDRLHQTYRKPAMEQSVLLVERLRAHGLAAVISGAGPSVLVLGVLSGDGASAMIDAVMACGVDGYDVLPLRPEGVGARVRRDG